MTIRSLDLAGLRRVLKGRRKAERRQPSLERTVRFNSSERPFHLAGRIIDR